MTAPQHLPSPPNYWALRARYKDSQRNNQQLKSILHNFIQVITTAQDQAQRALESIDEVSDGECDAEMEMGHEVGHEQTLDLFDDTTTAETGSFGHSFTAENAMSSQRANKRGLDDGELSSFGKRARFHEPTPVANQAGEDTAHASPSVATYDSEPPSPESPPHQEPVGLSEYGHMFLMQSACNFHTGNSAFQVPSSEHRSYPYSIPQVPYLPPGY
eukprot:GFYU01002727.1.p1 GENE.GFYU01002727.1~~GFYU01002727.1.p1  ORF type:complete len:216 (-),score=6.35 GFYU01002727.1:577-1224(-)